MIKLIELYGSMSEKTLYSAIKEIQEYDKTGLFGETIKKYAKLSGEYTNGVTTNDYDFAQRMILREAAFRWLKLVDVF